MKTYVSVYLLFLSLSLFIPLNALAKHPDSVVSKLADHVNAQGRPLRVMFYGQSITKQEWWLEVVERLREEYPETEIVAQNPAIGGFASSRLIVTTPRDVLLFRPDLIVFHVFGAHDDYERIMHFIRSRTAAELLIANDHYNRRTDVRGEDEGWTAFMNHKYLPAIAEAYGLRLLDVRGQWKQHLIENDMESGDVLRDGVHLNDAGNALMARIIAKELIDQPHDRELTVKRAETLLNIGQDKAFEDGELSLDFDGSRIDAVVDAETPAVFEVLLDGKPVSANADLYQATRPLDRDEDWPWQVGGPVRIGFDKIPQGGTFTIKFLEGDIEKATFEVTSETAGAEGRGTTEEDFLSESGRIRIAGEDWWRTAKGPDPEPVKAGTELTYRWQLLGVDSVEAGPDQPSHWTLCSGLPNTGHSLTLRVKAGEAGALKRLRIVQPPLPADAPDDRVSRQVSPHGSDKVPEFIFSPL